MDVALLSIEDTQKLPGALLWRVSKLWQSTMHGTLTGLGLSSTNAIVLSNILRLELEGKDVTQSQLAALCSVDRMTASTILRALEAKGFIERKVHGADKRSIELTLTSEGRTVAHEALRRVSDVHQKFFELIDDEQLRQLTTGLSELLVVNTVDRN